MDVREKLVELVNAVLRCLPWGEISSHTAEDIADHILADGWTKQEWISAKDRLPDTAERVLVCRTWLGSVYKPLYGYYQDFPNQKGCWYILTEEGYCSLREVTHWMPLPKPPKGE